MADDTDTISGEIRKPVVGYEGLYEVSSLGNVKRLERWISAKCDSRKLLPEMVTAGFPNRRGYPQIKVFGRNILVHQLVCAAFNGPKPSPQHEVAHRNDVKTDNRAENLRWATHAENSADAARHGLYNRGERVAAGKLTADQVREIRRRHTGAHGQIKALAAEFGVRSENIIAITKRRAWKHIE